MRLVQLHLNGGNVSMRTETTCAVVAVEEKRRERRYPTRDPAGVKKLPHSEEPIQANVVDVSKSGVKLEIGRQLIPGEPGCSTDAVQQDHSVW